MSFLSRRQFFQYAVVTTASAAVAVAQTDTALAQAGTSNDDHADPRPLDPQQTLLELMDRYPLVALSEAHQLQDQHDFVDRLLHHPRLPGKINAIVVEFGNARYQDIADQFVMGQAVANKALKQIWRNTVVSGGNPVWDAPVYEQLFRIVREINHSLPVEKRIRVLLGSPPVDWSTVAQFDDWTQFALRYDAHYVSVIENEVLQKGLHALLIAGSGHFLRGLRVDGDPRQPSSTWPYNAGTILNQKYPGKLFVVNPLVLNPGQQDQVSQLVTNWQGPAIALLDHTWLAAQPVPASERNAATTMGAMCDAVLYFGGVDVLTASRADPSLYQGGDYAAELLRRGNMLVQWGVQQGNPLENALHIAELGPSFYVS